MVIVVLGIWTVILPHLGVPRSFDTILLTATGIIIIGMGLYLRAAHLTKGARRTTHHPFVENTGAREIHNHGHSDGTQG